MTCFLDKKERLKKLKGTGIQHILNSAYEILGNPILMFDTSYNLLAFTEGIVTDDWLWNELTTLGTFSHETVDFFNSEHFILSYAGSEVVSLMQSSKLKYDRMNGKLFDRDNVQLGDINVTACSKPFEENDMELIEFLCEILSIELQNSEFYQNIERVYQESLLDDFIEGNLSDSDIVKNRVEKLHSELKPNLYVAVVDVTLYEQTNTHLAYFRDLFRKLQPEYKYYVHLNNIVIIINTDYTILSVKRDLDKLNEFFAKYTICAGVSRSFSDLYELREHFRQAINALNYGLKSKRKQQFFNYDDFSMEYFLQNIVGDAKEGCNPAIFLIQEYDRINNTSLLNMLYYYLLYGMDISLASAGLGILPEKLSGGLKKLEELFEINWKDGNMLFNLFLSIKMLDEDDGTAAGPFNQRMLRL